MRHGNTRIICEICSKLTVKTSGISLNDVRHRSDDFIVDAEHISHIVLVFFIDDFE